MELGDEQLVALLDLVKREWNDVTIETDVEFYCNLYLKLILYCLYSLSV